jgi:hypothetical protein
MISLDILETKPMDTTTDNPIMFDACSFYAHNECMLYTLIQSTALLNLGSLPLEMIWASVNDILGHTRNQTDCMLVPIAQPPQTILLCLMPVLSTLTMNVCCIL